MSLSEDSLTCDRGCWIRSQAGGCQRRSPSTKAQLKIPPEEAYEVLEPHLVRGPELLGNRGSFVAEQRASARLDASLALIEPQDLELALEHSSSPKGYSARARFSLAGCAYNLPLTEYVVAPRLENAGFGTHSLSDLELTDPGRVLLTVSLGTEWNQRRYKLIAAVLRLP